MNHKLKVLFIRNFVLAITGKLLLIIGFGFMCIFMTLPVCGAEDEEVFIENGYSFIIENGSAVITAYSGSGGEINIPWSLGGVEVTEIRTKVFADNELITTVNLPNSITKIGQAAFSGCTNLLNIRLSSRVGYLSDDLFKNCTSLSSILIPDRVSGIGNNVFTGCTGLTYVYFESTRRLSSIGTGAFQGTPWFEQQKDEFVIVGNGVLIKYNGTAKQITLPWNAYYVADAFTNNTQIEEITLAEWTKGILVNAFSGCSSLKTVKFGEWVTAIGSRAFENCSALESVVLPDKIQAIGSYAFAGCQNLKNVSLPKGLIKLQPGTFKDCKSLQSLILPDLVNEIGANAFENCWALEFIQIGGEVEKIGKAAFIGCSALTSLILPDKLKEIGAGAFQNCGFKNILLPKGLQIIEPNLFSGCNRLEKIALPDSLISIDETAFPDSVTLFQIPDKASLPEKERIMAGKDTTSFVEKYVQNHDLHYEFLPVSTGFYEMKRSVDSGTFTILRTLKDYQTSIIIPSYFDGSSVTKIGTAAFQDHSLLESVVIREPIEEIMDWAFSYCTNLKEVYIGESVHVIGADAFSGDSSLETAFIPPSVQTFGERAFKDCPLLTILGKPGSAAESFAKSNGIPFKAGITESE
jgi:hypothetical protein